MEINLELLINLFIQNSQTRSIVWMALNLGRRLRVVIGFPPLPFGSMPTMMLEDWYFRETRVERGWGENLVETLS